MQILQKKIDVFAPSKRIFLLPVQTYHTPFIFSCYYTHLSPVCLTSSPFFHYVHLFSLVTHMLGLQRYPNASNLQRWSPPAKRGDPRGIYLTNHCLKPLRVHRPRDKDSRKLYRALAGLSGCLCREWRARLLPRWKIAAGQPIPNYLSIFLSDCQKSSNAVWTGTKECHLWAGVASRANTALSLHAE